MFRKRKPDDAAKRKANKQEKVSSKILPSYCNICHKYVEYGGLVVALSPGTTTFKVNIQLSEGYKL
jgi:hypothetical protein